MEVHHHPHVEKKSFPSSQSLPAGDFALRTTNFHVKQILHEHCMKYSSDYLMHSIYIENKKMYCGLYLTPTDFGRLPLYGNRKVPYWETLRGTKFLYWQ